MTDSRNALPLQMIPYDDHLLIQNLIFKGSLDEDTRRTYLYSYRYAMEALLEEDKGLLELPLASRILMGASIICLYFLRYLRPVVAVGEIRQLRRVLSILLRHEVKCFDNAIISIRKWAREEGQWDRRRAQSKSVHLGVDLPPSYQTMISNIRDARKQDGSPLALSSIESGIKSFSLFLGVLQERGVEWRSVGPLGILTEANMNYLLEAWCQGEESWLRSQRVNELGCALKHMLPGQDVSIVFSAAAEVRKRNPGGNFARAVKNNVPLDDIPDEDLARFCCACPTEARRRKLKYNFGMNARSFQFEGRRIRIDRSFKAGMVTEMNLLDCLRALITSIRLTDPALADMPTEKRDYDRVAEIFGSYYADNHPATVVNRLEHLRMLLNRLLPKGTQLIKLETMIQDSKAAIERNDIVVPSLLPTTIYQAALDELASSYAKFCDLRNASASYVSATYFAEIFRDNLMIAMLTRNPLRLASLQSMLVSDVRSVNIDGTHTKSIVIPKERTKTGHPIRFFIPQLIEPWLERYLDVVRAHIAPLYEGEAFWLSRSNAPLSRDSIKNSIPNLMTAMHGVRVNVHLFRHIVATSEYDAGETISSLENSLVIREKHYIDSETKAKASKQTCLSEIFDEVIEGLNLDLEE